jgi:hypothetical protein
MAAHALEPARHTEVSLPDVEPLSVLVQRVQQDINDLRKELASLATGLDELRASITIDDEYAMRLCGGARGT